MKDVLTIMGLGFSDLHIFGERSVFIGGTGGGGLEVKGGPHKHLQC